MRLPLLGLAAALCVALIPAYASAETAAKRANVGLRTQLGPVLLIPTDGGPMGGGLDFGLRYGIEAGPLVIGPGARAAGYFISRRFIGDAMPTVRLTLPAGPFAPFVEGGVGIGGLSNPGESGAAIMAGGGLMIHFGNIIAVGARATYETITGTEFKTLALGPSIQFGF